MDYDPFASTLNNQDFGDSDPFKGTLSTDAIPKSENLLQRAANKLLQPTIDSLAQAVGGTLTTEATCLVRNFLANAVLFNFTAAAVG